MEMFTDLPCPACRGRKGETPCRRCGGRNVYVVDGCPLRHVDEAAIEALKLMKWADRHVMPRSGGLDVQRHRDVRLIEMAWAETAKARAATDE